MKFEFYPVTDADHEAADKQHEETRESTQNFYERVAVKIENGEELNGLERAWIAAGVRHLGTLIPEKRPRPNKRPPKVPGDAAVVVASRVLSGVTKAQAIEELAEKYGFEDDSTIKKALQRQGYEEIKRDMLRSEGKK